MYLKKISFFPKREEYVVPKIIITLFITIGGREIDLEMRN